MQNLSRPMILVIDDSEPERALTRKMLEAEGYEVREAADGDEGLALIKELRPALVLCDLLMPKHSGFDIVTDIRAVAPAVPIVAVSGTLFGFTDHTTMKESLGLSGVVEKPFRHAQLLAAVRAALGARPSLR